MSWFDAVPDDTVFLEFEDYGTGHIYTIWRCSRCNGWITGAPPLPAGPQSWACEKCQPSANAVAARLLSQVWPE